MRGNAKAPRTVAVVVGVLFAVLTACSDDSPKSQADDARAAQSTSVSSTAAASVPPSAAPTESAAGEGGNPKAPKCEVLYAEGAPAVLDETQVCDNGTEALQGFVFKTQECEDGRVLMHHLQAWGYQGELWHPYAAGVAPEPPQAEQDTCSGESSDASDGTTSSG